MAEGNEEKINFLGGKLPGRGDDALSKAGAVTSGDYSRPQLKHYHKCAPGLGRSVGEWPLTVLIINTSYLVIILALLFSWEENYIVGWIPDEHLIFTQSKFTSK